MVKDYQKIMVAVDGSESSQLAFQKSVNVAKRNKGELILIHVIDTRAFQTISSFDDELANEATETAKQTLKDYTFYAETQGLTAVRQVVEYGTPKNLIANDLPERYQADLIMLGATGLNAVERLLIGSVSEHVIRHAPCDVLVVRTGMDNK